MRKKLKDLFRKKKIYAYENSEGDKGIIIAYSKEEARQLFQKAYPNRKVADSDEEYWNNGAYLYEFGELEEESRLYCTFEC